MVLARATALQAEFPIGPPPGSLLITDLRNCLQRGLVKDQALKTLGSIRSLELDTWTALTNVDVLKGLTQLQTLDLTNCPALTKVDVLKGLRNLRTLSLRITPISDAAIKDLQKALPDVKIVR